MRVPQALEPLFHEGLIEEVIRPLQSGKEAAVYLVVSEGVERVAKVYKEAAKRSFRQRADYTEGRGTRRSRDARAMKRGSRYGRQQKELAWQNAEVDALYRLAGADVRVPQPHAFHEGVLLMDLVTGEGGRPALRLYDIRPTADEARDMHEELIRFIVRMLCVGVVHGDLSEFNILMGHDGPTIIDLPQAVDPAHNRNARKLLIRDAQNVGAYLGRYAPELRRKRYGDEIWDLYERAALEPETPLTGNFKRKQGRVDMSGLMSEIQASADEQVDADPRIAEAIAELRALAEARESGRSQEGSKSKRSAKSPGPRVGKGGGGGGGGGDRGRGYGEAPQADGPGDGTRKRRRRRRRKGGGGGSEQQGGGQQGRGQQAERGNQQGGRSRDRSEADRRDPRRSSSGERSSRRSDGGRDSGGGRGSGGGGRGSGGGGRGSGGGGRGSGGGRSSGGGGRGSGGGGRGSGGGGRGSGGGSGPDGGGSSGGGTGGRRKRSRKSRAPEVVVNVRRPPKD